MSFNFYYGSHSRRVESAFDVQRREETQDLARRLLNLPQAVKTSDGKAWIVKGNAKPSSDKYVAEEVAVKSVTSCPRCKVEFERSGFDVVRHMSRRGDCTHTFCNSCKDYGLVILPRDKMGDHLKDKCRVFHCRDCNFDEEYPEGDRQEFQKNHRLNDCPVFFCRGCKQHIEYEGEDRSQFFKNHVSGCKQPRNNDNGRRNNSKGRRDNNNRRNDKKKQEQETT